LLLSQKIQGLLAYIAKRLVIASGGTIQHAMEALEDALEEIDEALREKIECEYADRKSSAHTEVEQAALMLDLIAAHTRQAKVPDNKKVFHSCMLPVLTQCRTPHCFAFGSVRSSKRFLLHSSLCFRQTRCHFFMKRFCHNVLRTNRLPI
jgi:hypothetical protein